MKTVILCGGRGYRLKEETEFIPKPMIEIGGQPILWHIMNIYAAWGFNEFIIALGYKGNVIKNYFVNKKYYDGDFTLYSKSGRIKLHYKNRSHKFKITFVDTGLESLTGERVRRIKKYIDTPDFMVTYGDGLANINIPELVKFHRHNKVTATVTGVNPMLKYGGLDADPNSRATGYEKKARIKQLINGGFMVLKRGIFKRVLPDSMIEDIFDELIDEKQLAVYKHPGFFHAMDTYQDVEDLNTMWKNNPAWKIWK